MRVRTLGRRVGQLVVVAAFGVGATVGTTSPASAEDTTPSGSETADASTTESGGASTDTTSWE